MGDYIEREGLLDEISAARDNGGMGAIVAGTLTRYIKRAPAADVRPVVRGRWSWRTGSEYRCTNCGRHTHVDEVMEDPAYNYCPYCGADMREGSEQ